jgi:hypothetical protein
LPSRKTGEAAVSNEVVVSNEVAVTLGLVVGTFQLMGLLLPEFNRQRREAQNPPGKRNTLPIITDSWINPGIRRLLTFT